MEQAGPIGHGACGARAEVAGPQPLSRQGPSAVPAFPAVQPVLTALFSPPSLPVSPHESPSRFLSSGAGPARARVLGGEPGPAWLSPPSPALWGHQAKMEAPASEDVSSNPDSAMDLAPSPSLSRPPQCSFLKKGHNERPPRQLLNPSLRQAACMSRCPRCGGSLSGA